MLRLSLKTVFFSVFSVIAALYVISCVQPPDYNAFLKDPDVKDKIERDRVNITSASDSGLTTGDRRITNLNPDKYYMIKTETGEEQEVVAGTDVKKSEALNEDEEGDEEGEEDETSKKDKDDKKTEVVFGDPEFGFISREGRITEKLEDIGKVTGKAIINLKNSRINKTETTPAIFTKYTVKSAAALTGKISYYENLSGVSEIDDKTPKKQLPSNRIIAAPDEGKFHFLDLSSFIKEADKDENGVNDFLYEPPFAINPNPEDDNETAPVCILNMEKKALQLSRAYLSVDYLLVERNEKQEITNFNIITINYKKGDKTQEDGTILKLEITYSGDITNPLEIISDAQEYIQSEDEAVINFEVVNSSDYSEISWYTDADDPASPAETGPNFAMDFSSDLKYQIIGTYYIYVTAKLNASGEFFGACVEIKVEAHQ